MAEVVAFEGKRNARLYVAWGTAAIRDGETLRNGTRGMSAVFVEDEFRALVQEGALTELPKPIEISAEEGSRALVVLEIETTEGFEHQLHVDRNRITTVIAATTSATHHYYVFDGHDTFRQVAETIIGQILECLLYLEEWNDAHERLLRSAMALDAHHPVVNALRAFRSKNANTFLPVARSNLRSDDARDVFENAWLAFTNTDLRYVLKYKGGLVREEGGIQIGDVAKLMKSIQHAHPILATTITRRYPFLQRPPETQLYELKAASAEFHFTVPAVSLGERLARYLELRLFERSLDGDVPEDGAKSPAFVEAVRQITKPDEKTLVSQRLGSAALRPVQTTVATEGKDDWSTPLTVLGYQSGLVRDTEQIEINIFPGERILVSSTDNGSKQRPIGLDFLQTTRDFLYHPALYKIQRRRHELSERFFLQEVVVLKPGTKGVATAIHSSVVAGAFVCNLEIRVNRPNVNKLTFGDATLSGIDARAIGDAREWMLRFSTICRGLELADTRHGRLAPSKMGEAPFLIQVLWAVAELGGEAAQNDVVEKINEHYTKSALVNNTRREVRRNKTLLGFHEEDGQTIVILPEGKLYLAAYDRVARRVR
jgi:hypothetical protein